MIKNYPAATIQDALVEIFPNVYLLRGSIQVAPLLRINRNMTVLKQDTELTIINAVRLNEENLKQLDQLGTVKHVIRLGDFHGLDDQFYLDRYQAKLWSQEKHLNYPSLQPDIVFTSETAPPINQSEFFIFKDAKYPEAALLLKQHQLLMTTDSVQYWDDWRHFTFLSKIVMWLIGFRLKLFIGGPWLKLASIHKHSLKKDFQQLLTLDFKHLISAHGHVCLDHAKTDLEHVVQIKFRD